MGITLFDTNETIDRYPQTDCYSLVAAARIDLRLIARLF